MIVDPDFIDHWKTRMVVDALGGDELAPLYIMRLWAHCQTRRGEVFDIPTSGIKAICKFAGDAKVLEDALMSANYLSREDKTVTVVGWLEKNASLVAAWNNGNRGGRPKKQGKETQGEPNENPWVTRGLPKDNPTKTHGEPIREDKRREDITPLPPSGEVRHIESFGRFWSAYPRKVGKGAAESAFKRIKPGAEVLEQMLSALSIQKRSSDWIKEDGRYIPNPATWLNQKRWLDEPPAASVVYLNGNGVAL